MIRMALSPMHKMTLGFMSRHDRYEIWVDGKITARKLRNIRKMLDLDIEMMDEEEALQAFESFDPCI